MPSWRRAATGCVCRARAPSLNSGTPRRSREKCDQGNNPLHCLWWRGLLHSPLAPSLFAFWSKAPLSAYIEVTGLRKSMQEDEILAWQKPSDHLICIRWTENVYQSNRSETIKGAKTFKNMLQSPTTALKVTSENYSGWKRPLRSPSPAFNLPLPSPPLNHPWGNAKFQCLGFLILNHTLKQTDVNEELLINIKIK